MKSKELIYNYVNAKIPIIKIQILNMNNTCKKSMKM